MAPLTSTYQTQSPRRKAGVQQKPYRPHLMHTGPLIIQGMAGALLKSGPQMPAKGQPHKHAFLGSPVRGLLHELSSAQLPSDQTQRGSCEQLGKLKPG